MRVLRKTFSLRSWPRDDSSQDPEEDEGTLGTEYATALKISLPWAR